MEAASDKFERRLTEESGALKLGMAELRLEIEGVRLEIAKSHNSLLRWMFASWMTTMLGMVELFRIFSVR